MIKDLNHEIFVGLFKDAYRKCFGLPLSSPLSETESRHFANKIFDETGLVIGAKTIKNYSFYIIHNKDAKQENPSVATLDTLARYVLNAPYTDEIKRKDNEGHYPYWFQYKGQFAASAQKESIEGGNIGARKDSPGKSVGIRFNALALIFLGIASIVLIRFFYLKTNDKYFAENFHTVAEDSLKKNGWFLKARDEQWWSKRNQLEGSLTLFTLRGDNWADSVNAPGIKNLLLRKISSDCFTTEVHFDNFIPKQNWQQAGIILLEDSNFSGKSLRLSIAYNDFFGGYSKPGEIIIQAISSGGNDLSKPEEIGHLPLYNIEAGQENLLLNNLRNSALKIEKNGNHFRFLSSVGPMENAAFKELLSKDFVMQPKYIGIFALQGFVNDTNYIPARIKFFNLTNTPCGYP